MLPDNNNHAAELWTACQQGNTAQVQSIVSQYPDSVGFPDNTNTNNGWTSLHYACAFGAPIDLVHALVLADPRVVGTKTAREGCTALHLAAGCPETRVEVIDFLIQQSQNSGVNLAQELDLQGRSALHWVCQGSPRPEGKSHASLEIVRAVYNAWKEATSLADEQAQLPIHHSYLSGAPGSQIRYLAHLDPSSVSAPLPDGRLLAHHVAADLVQGKAGANPDVLESLLAADSATLYVQDPLSGRTLAEQSKQRQQHAPDASRFLDIVRKFENRGTVGGGGGGKKSQGSEEKKLKGLDQKMDSSSSSKIESEPPSAVANKIVLACSEMVDSPEQIRQVRSLLDSCADAVRVRDEQGFLPVHWACYHGAAADVLKLMLDAFPESVREKATGGLLPLHLACRKGNTIEQVQYLLSLFPDSIRVPAQEGKFPIHYACRHAKSPGLIQFLVEQWPQSLREPSQDGKASLPIHLLCKGGSSVPIEWMILQDPSLLQISDEEGNLPVHLLCGNPKTTTELVKAVLDAFPDAATQANKKGFSPADLAADVNPEVSDFLENALLAKRRRVGGKRPVHQACSDPRVTVAMLRSILTESPDEVCMPDEERMLPIHLACRSGASLSVVRYLVEEWPESLRWTNKGGSVPLHVACSNKASADTIRYLITSWPKATSVANNYGWLPLHSACAYGASSEVISLLVRSNAKSSIMATYGQGDFPLHLACCGSPSLEVIFWLIEAREEGIRLQNAAGELALHKACFNDAPIEVIQFLVEQYPHSLFVEDQHGSTPQQIAEMRKHLQKKNNRIDVSEWFKSKAV